jgi:hypothetical protein
MISPEQLAASNTEHGHQCALFCWAAQQCNEWQATPKILGNITGNALAQQLSLMFAIPNGGLRHKATAGNLKAEGVKSGVPDIMLPVAQRSKNSLAHYDTGTWHGLFIEMKKPSEKPKNGNSKGGVSSNQNEWHIALRAQGYLVFVCYTWEEARDVVLRYLGVTP